MKQLYTACIIAMYFLTTSVMADSKGDTQDTKNLNKVPLTVEQQKQGEKAFLDVYTVLQHPRCLNCHPKGNAPLQNDDFQPHAMNITRASTEAGLECAACHQEKNAEAYGVVGGPPGAPNWHLPTKEMPLVFEGRSPKELCEQIKNTDTNGQKSLEELHHHVAYDPLVLWGWNPGGKRSVPPLSHSEFSQKFKQWVDLGGPCPSE